MDLTNTYYLLAAVEEMAPEQNFFRNRYFPTDVNMDVFGTSKVLADYKESKQRRAPFVVPRIGSLPVGREGFSTYELEPPCINISMPMTIDQLTQRGFGEALMSQRTPEERAAYLQMRDLMELNARITRTEECMACTTMLENGGTMRHLTDQKDVYEDVKVKFYDGETNPAVFKPTKKWTHSSKNASGVLQRGSFYTDICKMVRMLTSKGKPAVDLLVSSEVGDWLMDDEWILKVLDTSRMEMGRIAPTEMTDYVTYYGTFNFGGRMLNIIGNSGTYDEDGVDTPFLVEGTAIVTAPGVGRCLYGAHTQLEPDGNYHTYAGARVPQHLFTLKPPTKETALASHPLMVPRRANPWVAAKNVL